ncbi:Retrovirus-related Pol polyprotein from transposon TNT 1-94 [Cucumis melo var. makuwa]|uniref:Retrovirus-related Pol polyprotein from transposon TNT 1-94 n=2 Tax=Cucumis melo var. makuwa TaxID=1194695 RepID=A0A5D3CNM6_CUCMM|nr:Retrovirus-related Pol polyprotein from transposon TNT 1-94 [Cucumis melo var. makuwa]
MFPLLLCRLRSMNLNQHKLRTYMTVSEENTTARSDKHLTDTQMHETSLDDLDMPKSYDPSLYMLIALRKGTRAFIASLDTVTIPKNIHEAMKNLKWKMTVREEMGTLEKNKTWDLCALPKGQKTVGCKWMFTLKYKSDRTLDKYKTQSGFFYLLQSIKRPLYQLDVKNALLNGDLKYMSPPSGFRVQFDHQVYDIVEITRLKKKMGDEFEIKDLGNMKYFLGMEVARSKEGISISQSKYNLDLLKETSMIGCRPADTPMEFNAKLGNPGDEVPIDKGKYKRLVVKLIYLSHTRPDVSYIVSTVSQFMQVPYKEHMEAVNCI